MLSVAKVFAFGFLLIFLALMMRPFIPQNNITGLLSADSTVNVIQATPVPCKGMLTQGFNQVSFYCIPNYLPHENLSNSISDLIAVFDYTGSASDPWKVYNPTLPSYVVNDLESYSRYKGYFVRVGQNSAFFYNGTLASNNAAPLSIGWNLAGYVSNETQDIVNATASIDGNYTVIRTLVPGTLSFIEYVPGSGGTLNETIPLRGYWINATVDEEWEVG